MPIPKTKGVTTQLTALILLSISGVAAIIVWTLAPQAPVSFKITNSAILITSCACLVLAGNRGYSLYHTFFLYTLIFFSIIPTLEISTKTLYWGANEEVFKQYPGTSFICFICQIVFLIFYRPLRKRRGATTSETPAHRISPTRLIALSSTGALTILAYNEFSFLSILFRGGEYTTRVSTNQVIWLIYNYFFFPIPSICLVIYLNVFPRRRPRHVYPLVLIALLFNPISGMARFLSATLYTAILVSAFPQLLRRKFILTILIIFGLFVVFPLLDLARHFSETTEVKLNLNWILNGHFDGFQLFSGVLQNSGVSWGYQLLGVIFFFIPRSLWPDKPIGSGAEYAHQVNLDWDNIAMPLPAEGYLNFGLLGSLGFVAVGAIVAYWFDNLEYNRRLHQNVQLRTYYLFSLGLFLFVLRGDLLSSYAYSMGILSSVYFVTKFSQK